MNGGGGREMQQLFLQYVYEILPIGWSILNNIFWARDTLFCLKHYFKKQIEFSCVILVKDFHMQAKTQYLHLEVKNV